MTRISAIFRMAKKHIGAYRSSFHLFFFFFKTFSFFFFFAKMHLLLLSAPTKKKNSALRNNHDYTFHNNTQMTRRTRGNTNDAVYKKLNIVSEKHFFYTKVMKAFLRPAFKKQGDHVMTFFCFYKRVNSSHLFTLFTISKRY